MSLNKTKENDGKGLQNAQQVIIKPLRALFSVYSNLKGIHPIIRIELPIPSLNKWSNLRTFYLIIYSQSCSSNGKASEAWEYEHA